MPASSYPAPWNSLILQHDAAGAVVNEDGSVMPAADSYRGGATLFIDRLAAQTDIGIHRWNDQQLKLHSSALEQIQGNSGMEFAILNYDKDFLLEVYDSVPACAVSRVLAAGTNTMRGLAMQRSHVVLDLTEKRRALFKARGWQYKDFRIFSFWRRRSTQGGQMADDGSKQEWANIAQALDDASLPALATVPVCLPAPVESPYDQEWFVHRG
jgi:hypothetical protein